MWVLAQTVLTGPERWFAYGGALGIAVFVGLAVLRLERWTVGDLRKTREAAEVEHKRCRDEVQALREELAVERWRTAMLIRAMQQAGLKVPEAAMLEVNFDPATGTYRIKGRGD